MIQNNVKTTEFLKSEWFTEFNIDKLSSNNKEGKDKIIFWNVTPTFAVLLNETEVFMKQNEKGTIYASIRIKMERQDGKAKEFMVLEKANKDDKESIKRMFPVNDLIAVLNKQKANKLGLEIKQVKSRKQDA